MTKRLLLMISCGATALSTGGGATEQPVVWPVRGALAQECPVPVGWGVHEGPLPPRSFALSAEGGNLRWNGAATEEARLPVVASVLRPIESRPPVIFYTRGVECDDQQRLAALVAGAVRCRPDNCLTSLADPPPLALMSPPVPPPPPSPSGTRPTPRGSPQSWVTNDDYPPAALSERMEGMTAFQLELSAEGRVAQCQITSSSGFPILDATTCALLKRRARFNPARDVAGRAVPGLFNSRIRWTLPPLPVAPLASWARVTSFTVSQNGLVTSCASRVHSVAPLADADVCGDLRQVSSSALRALPGASARPVVYQLIESNLIEGLPAPPTYVVPAGAPVFAHGVRFRIDGAGAARDCEVVETIGSDIPEFLARDCRPRTAYVREDAALDDRVAVNASRLFITGAGPDPIRPQIWLTDSDYPPAALRARIQGVVAFTLDVDASGSVSRCTVTASSGSELLDDTTCGLMRRRARFVPATDAQGIPITSQWSSRFTWSIR